MSGPRLLHNTHRNGATANPAPLASILRHNFFFLSKRMTKTPPHISVLSLFLSFSFALPSSHSLTPTHIQIQSGPASVDAVTFDLTRSLPSLLYPDNLWPFPYLDFSPLVNSSHPSSCLLFSFNPWPYWISSVPRVSPIPPRRRSPEQLTLAFRCVPLYVKVACPSPRPSMLIFTSSQLLVSASLGPCSVRVVKVHSVEASFTSCGTCASGYPIKSSGESSGYILFKSVTYHIGRAHISHRALQTILYDVHTSPIGRCKHIV